jgi:hypothetical protein
MEDALEVYHHKYDPKEPVIPGGPKGVELARTLRSALF